MVLTPTSSYATARGTPAGASRALAGDILAVHEAAFANLPDMLALAKYPNVAIKATGEPSYSSEAYPYRNIHGHLRRIYDAFGPERMFWGTDITRMPCSWRQCVTLFAEELPWLPARDKELIMGRAVCAWLDWRSMPTSASRS